VVLDSKEDDDARKSNTAGEGGRQDVVVLLPPGGLVPLKEVHEDRRDVDAGSEVGQVNGSPEEETVEDERGVNMLEASNRGEQDHIQWLENGRGKRGLSTSTDVFAEALDRPPEKGEQEAEEEAVLENRVNLAEDARGTDGTLEWHVSVRFCELKPLADK
jgi:hypothetical protein